MSTGIILDAVGRFYRLVPCFEENLRKGASLDLMVARFLPSISSSNIACLSSLMALLHTDRLLFILYDSTTLKPHARCLTRFLYAQIARLRHLIDVSTAKKNRYFQGHIPPFSAQKYSGQM